MGESIEARAVFVADLVSGSIHTNVKKSRDIDLHLEEHDIVINVVERARSGKGKNRIRNDRVVTQLASRLVRLPESPGCMERTVRVINWLGPGAVSLSMMYAAPSEDQITGGGSVLCRSETPQIINCHGLSPDDNLGSSWLASTLRAPMAESS